MVAENPSMSPFEKAVEVSTGNSIAEIRSQEYHIGTKPVSGTHKLVNTVFGKDSLAASNRLDRQQVELIVTRAIS